MYMRCKTCCKKDKTCLFYCVRILIVVKYCLLSDVSSETEKIKQL